MSVKIRPVTLQDAEAVSRLVGALINELRGVPPAEARSLDVDMVRQVLSHTESVSGFLLVDDEDPIGILMLSESTSLYAKGTFGTITELYVASERRSSGLAEQLMARAVEYGKERCWTMLEVGAPPQPKWQRSRAFYLNNDFKEIGPRLRRRLLTRPNGADSAALVTSR